MFPTRTFSAFLFDMDGTLLDSIAVANRVWSQWALGHGLDPDAVLHTMHGVRAIETVRRWAPAGVDTDKEADAVTLAEMNDVDGIEPIAGILPFLASLPEGRWAIVTSAPRALALKRLAAAGITPPPVLVSSEDVSHGKPAPDCFVLAARRLGVDPADCVVFEDAPAGIKAGEAAGASVIVIGATHATPMQTPHPVIPHYSDLRARVTEDGRLALSPAA